METKTIDRLFATVLILLGAYVVWHAVGYGYLRETTPGPGFFPFWVGLALTALSAVNLARSLRGIAVPSGSFGPVESQKALGATVAIAVYILMAPLLGLLAGSSLLVLATAFVIRPRWTAAFALKILAVALAFPIFGHFLFGVYLRVPLVKGVLGF
jgi:hypothetical protein